MLFTLITGRVVDHYSYTPVFIAVGLLALICAIIPWGPDCIIRVRAVGCVR